MLVVTVPVTFVLILLGITIRDRVLDPVVSGGMIALLGAIVSIVVTKGDNKMNLKFDDAEDEENYNLKDIVPAPFNDKASDEDEVADEVD